MKKKQYKKIFLKTSKALVKNIPTMLSIMFLIGIMKTFISFEALAKLFTGNYFIDTIYGSLLGSVLAGNAINSYVIGKEMLLANISLFAITAFIVSWVTVGIVQLPLESEIFGKRFTYTRNILSTLLSIIIAILTVLTLGVIG
ncbi:hypothetical protein [Helicovermis profundi]|uniref:Permease n=1 Tax=Helicovermis profundi TaxID=3065157 RepID=A0AAU9E0Y5_9FIRM|nr:hypothetical protein HLPR_03020 [Clostridia bacterium S502]